MKICLSCKKEKEISEFGNCVQTNDGLRRECKFCYNKRMKKYYHSNEKYREKSKQQAKELRKKIRTKVFKHYSKGIPKCECCGITIYEFLVIDHINGDGNKQRKEGIKTVQFYRWLIKNNYPEGFRVLCTNCNFSYGIHGFCPHEKEKPPKMAVDFYQI